MTTQARCHVTIPPGSGHSRIPLSGDSIVACLTKTLGTEKEGEGALDV